MNIFYEYITKKVNVFKLYSYEYTLWENIFFENHLSVWRIFHGNTSKMTINELCIVMFSNCNVTKTIYQVPSKLEVSWQTMCDIWKNMGLVPVSALLLGSLFFSHDKSSFGGYWPRYGFWCHFMLTIAMMSTVVKQRQKCDVVW